MTADHDADMAGQTGWQILAPLIDLVTPMAVRVAATLRLADKDDLLAFEYEDFKLEGYQAHPSIAAPIAV